MVRAFMLGCLVSCSVAYADERSRALPAPPAKAASTSGVTLTAGTYSVEMMLFEFRSGRPQDRLDEFTKVDKPLDGRPEEATVLSSPKIRAVLGQVCNLQVGRGGKIPYLKQTGPKSFQKQEYELEDALGIQMNVRVHRQETIHASIRYQATSLAGTEGGSMLIAGVDVPIGKPLVAKNARTWEFSPDVGDVYEVDLPTPKGRYARLRLRVMIGEDDVQATP